jgi:hypothetical protein
MDDPDAKRAGATCECGGSLPFVSVFCTACKEVPLCLRCAVFVDVPLCITCRDESDAREAAVAAEEAARTAAEEMVRTAEEAKRKRCGRCGALDPTQCRECRAFLCAACSDSPTEHGCVRCREHGCVAHFVHSCNCRFCRATRYCQPCYERRHNSYECSGCHLTVTGGGADRFLCPFPGCERVYGCHFCCLFEGRGGIVCFEHSSQCSRCEQRYPLRRNCVVTLHRIRNAQMPVCPRCYFRVRALVECLLLRKGPWIPRELIEMIIVRAIEC